MEIILTTITKLFIKTATDIVFFFFTLSILVSLEIFFYNFQEEFKKKVIF